MKSALILLKQQVILCNTLTGNFLDLKNVG